MRRLSLFLLIILFAGQLSTSAEEKKSFWDCGLGKFLKKADNLVASWEESGVDTNYIRRCEKDRFFYLGSYTYYQQHDMNFPITVEQSDLPDEAQEVIGNFIPSNYDENRNVNMDMHTVQTELELGIDWRGITIEIPIPIRNKYSKSFGFAKNGSAWGFRIRFKELKNMNGKINNAYDNMWGEVTRRYLEYQESGADPSKAVDHTPFYSEAEDIPKGDLALRIFYVEGYYVFNHKHFCLSAGAYGDMIQKRPAGSLFAWINYYQSRLSCDNTFNAVWDTFRNNKVSLGLGYGYNIPFLGGKGCVHMSLVPMFSIYNHLTHKNGIVESTEEDAILWANYDRHYYDAVKYGQDSGITLNGLAKFAVSYSHKRMVFNLLMNYRQFLFTTSSKFQIANREADLQINVGYRF